MLKHKKKKQIFYEVNPLFFYDSNGDGFGDFTGLSKKIDYFSFMDIDCIIIPDIFNNYDNLLFNNYIDLKSKYGNLKDFVDLISNFKNKKIEFVVELNLKNIKKSSLFSANGSINDYSFEESKKTFFLDKSQYDKVKNWNSKKTIERFNKIIKFWFNLGVTNFSFVNFEHLYDKVKVFNNLTQEQLNNLYKMVNSISTDISIILKSALLSQKNINDCLNKKNPSADFFIDNSYSLIGTNNEAKNNQFEKFKPHKLFSRIKQSFIYDNSNINVVMALGSSFSGRINSRWGDEKSFNSFGSKALITVLLGGVNSSCIYYGDELGMLKINIQKDIDFNDIYAMERKQLLQSKGQSKEEFEKAQQYLSPINTQSLFQWDSSINGGFSKGIVTMRQLSTTYKEINVENQYHDSDSSLVYFKKMIEFIKNPIYSKFFNNSVSKIKLIKKDVLKYTHKYNDEKIFIFINLSKKWKKVNINNKLNVILSNYSDKKYNNKIKILAPFESIILF